MKANSPSPPPSDPPATPAWRRVLQFALAVVFLALLAGGLLLFHVVRMADARERAWLTARGNATQVMAALKEFQETYGTFPDDATAERVKAETKTQLTLRGPDSNQMLRQLLVRGLPESAFHVPGSGNAEVLPDGNDSDDLHALSPGECSFAYLAGRSGASDPDCPVIVAPLVRGTTRFELRRFPGMAVIGFADGSVRNLPLDGFGRVMLNGRDLFDAAQPYWGGKPPDIRWQE